MINLSPDVLITTGGTREQIDDVRYIGNFSSGRLGHALAERYTHLGKSVLLLSPKSTVDRFGLPDGVVHKSFMDTEDLESEMLAVENPELVLHAAAVADYKVEKTSGKIRSDAEKLTLNLVRTSKILKKLRSHYGKTTKIIGFKLLSGVEQGELLSVAKQQIIDNSTDLCVANDLQEIKEGSRKVYVVDHQGGYIDIRGNTQQVASRVSESIAVKLSYW
jgi:phosphopantothenoylcysteine synthetase/decarboxylase